MAEQQTTEQITQPQDQPRNDQGQFASSKKWEIDYQPTDENGQPIGRKTHLGPFETPEELIAAQQQSHIEATRAYFRVKNAKLDPAIQRGSFQPKDWDDSESLRVATEAQNPAGYRKAVRETIEAEIGAPIEEIRDTLIATRSLHVHQEVEAFKAEHPNYYVCPANRQAIEKWVADKGCEVTAANLAVAYEDLTLRGELQPRPQQNQLSPTDVEPAEEQQTNIPAPRRSAPSGIIPGQLNGNRQGTRKPSLTKADIAKWSAAELRRRMANPRERAEIERVANS